MKKIKYVVVVMTIFFSLSGCQKSDFYTKDFTELFGNTSDNVCQGGLMASTDEYLYLPSRDGVIEISQETGEPVILQDIKAEFGYINVVDGFLYYNADSNDENKRGLIVQSLDKKFFRQISKTSYYPFVVFGDWIYATNFRGGDLYKINSKNSEVIKLAEAPVEEFTLYSKGIFYNDGNNLYSIGLEGENKQKILSNIQLKSLTYLEKDNILIFINSSDDNKICSFNINKNELLIIRNGDYSFVQVFGSDEIVTLDSIGILQSFSLLDGHIGVEIPNVDNFQIYGQALYFFDNLKSLYCINDKNQEPARVYSTAD